MEDTYSDEDRLIKCLPEDLKDHWTRLMQLYPSFRGRQKQIVDLIMGGVNRRCDIARQLKMKPNNVSIELKKIADKILQGRHNERHK